MFDGQEMNRLRWIRNGQERIDGEYPHDHQSVNEHSSQQGRRACLDQAFRLAIHVDKPPLRGSKPVKSRVSAPRISQYRSAQFVGGYVTPVASNKDAQKYSTHRAGSLGGFDGAALGRVLNSIYGQSESWFGHTICDNYRR